MHPQRPDEPAAQMRYLEEEEEEEEKEKKEKEKCVFKDPLNPKSTYKFGCQKENGRRKLQTVRPQEVLVKNSRKKRRALK